MNRYILTLDDFRKENELNQNPTNVPLGYFSMQNSFIRFKQLKEKSFPEKLSYYCNPKVANCIIDGGTLWLNNVRKMNDSTEMDFAIEYLSNKRKMLHSSNIDPEIMKAINTSVDNLSHRKNWKETEIYGDKIVMAMCLSELNDDAGMWERYGEAGVSIQFNAAKLCRVVTTASNFFPSSGTYESGVAKICYRDVDCDCFQIMINQVKEAKNSAQNQNELILVRNLLHANLIELLMTHKHSSFQSEQEYRIFTLSPAVKTWSGSDHVYDHKLENTMSYHSEIDLNIWAINQSKEDFWNELISSVTFGPFINESYKNNLTSSLEKRGISDRIVVSKCPLQKL